MANYTISLHSQWMIHLSKWLSREGALNVTDSLAKILVKPRGLLVSYRINYAYTYIVRTKEAPVWFSQMFIWVRELGSIRSLCWLSNRWYTCLVCESYQYHESLFYQDVPIKVYWNSHEEKSLWNINIILERIGHFQI